MNALDPAKYYGFPGYLVNPESDSTVMAERLARRGLSITGNFTGTATRDNFRQAMREAAAELKAGDLLVIHYSGHGSDEGGLLDSVQSFCFYDGQLTENEFRQLLALFGADVRIAVIPDCCHAGGFDRALDGLVRPRVVPHYIRSQFKPDTSRAADSIAASVLLFCACKSSETASDGDQLGEWTGALVRALDNLASRKFTWRGWFEAAAELCQGQTPQLKQLGQPGLIDQPAFT